MHKKHYKLMAQAFAQLRASDPRDWAKMSHNDIINEIEDEICLILSDDNPDFNREKFTNASGRKD